MASSSITSSGETTRQPTPSLDSGRDVNRPQGVFAQDLLKPSIWLEEDIAVPVPGTSPGKNSMLPVLRIPSGKDDPARTKPGARGRNSGCCRATCPRCRLAKANLQVPLAWGNTK
jgi:hypothetical protein